VCNFYSGMFEQKTARSKTEFLRFLRNQGKLSAGESVKPVPE
jgi:hypothetical protein